MPESVQFDLKTTVDSVVIGAGAAGGVVARQLSEAGFTVVVLEQKQHGAPWAGPWGGSWWSAGPWSSGGPSSSGGPWSWGEPWSWLWSWSRG